MHPALKHKKSTTPTSTESIEAFSSSTLTVMLQVIQGEMEHCVSATLYLGTFYVDAGVQTVNSVQCCCKPSLVVGLCLCVAGVCSLLTEVGSGSFPYWDSSVGSRWGCRSVPDLTVSHLLAVWVRVLSSVRSGPSKSPTSPTSLSLKSQRSALWLVFTETLLLVQSCSWPWQNSCA